MAGAVSARGWPQRIAGERVTLRRDDSSADGAIAWAIHRKGEREAIGRAAVAFADGAPVIERLCIDEGARGYGAGSETAALLLETLARRHAVARAWAPPDMGLAVYFWIRMGFRPLAGEGPNGGLWFEQALR